MSKCSNFVLNSTLVVAEMHIGKSSNSEDLPMPLHAVTTVVRLIIQMETV